ncbi:hypothetical protein ACH47Z_18135 [Streptomyces sp. NPDC020192]|uniref:hypothetical protein n=1 Tax=Streptomyces sp. NPDC020192 TaxID=3365066 RepID=UPI0037A6DBEE
MTFDENGTRHDLTQCGAKKRQGLGTCGRPAGWGTDHPGVGRCKLHGGATKNQVVAAERVRVEREARLLLAELGEARPVTDPAAELQRVAGEVVAMKDAAARIVQGLSSMRYVGATGAEQLRAEVAVYERALDRAARVLADMVKLGLEARQVGLAEAQGALVAQAIRAILGELGLTPEQQARVSEVVPRHLRALAAADGGV